MDDDPDDLAAAFFAQQAAKEAKKTALPVKDWIRVIEDNNTSNDTTEQAIEKWLVTTLPNANLDNQGIVGIILNGDNCSLKEKEVAMEDEDCNAEIRASIKQLLVQQIESNLQKKKLNER